MSTEYLGGASIKFRSLGKQENSGYWAVLVLHCVLCEVVDQCRGQFSDTSPKFS